MTVLYAMQDGHGYVKFGVATDVRSRLSGIRTGNPTPVDLVGACNVGDAFELEQTIHYFLREIGLGASGEWFKPSLITTIVAACIEAGDADLAVESASDFWHHYGEHADDLYAQWLADQRV